MNFQHVILHEIKKEQFGDAELHLRESKLSLTEPVKTLIVEILKLYKKKLGKGLGTFEGNSTVYPFQKILKEFCDNPIDEKFIEFSHESMDMLFAKMNDQSLSVGGYVLFVKYADDVEDNMLIAMIRNRNSSAINKDLEVVSTLHVDLDKLHVCCQIDIPTWLDHDDPSPYMTFIKGRGNSTTPEYFLKFVGCSEFSDSKTQTEALVNALKNYCRQKGLSNDETINLSNKTADYCYEKQKTNQKVYVADLSRFINEESPDEFLEYINLNSKMFNIGNGFEIHKKSLTRLKRISGSTKKIDIRFDADLYGNQIQLTKDIENIELPANTLIVKDPPENLVAMIKSTFHE